MCAFVKFLLVASLILWVTYMSEPMFRSFISTSVIPSGFTFYKNSVHVFLDDGTKLVIKNSALTSLLRQAGFTKRDFNELPEYDKRDVILTAFDKGVKLDAVEIEPGVFVVFRVTSPEFTPIPHRVLFDFVRDHLAKKYGITVDPVVRKYSRRTAAFFPIFKREVKTANVNDAITAGVYVSNANTGHHSIKVYAYVEVLACSNGMTVKNVGKRIRIMHVRNIERILHRVAEAVDNILSWLKKKLNILIADLERLTEEELTEDEIREWLEDVLEKLPKKYRRWFESITRKYIRQYGRNKYALWQTLTYFAPRLEKVNEDLAQRLNSMAVKLVARAY